MRTRKTSAKNRGHYNYYFDNGEVFTLIPGKNGVTEELIKILHAQDDREVHTNIKNMSVKRKDHNNSDDNPDKTKKQKLIWVESFDAHYEDIAEEKSKLMFDASLTNTVDNVEKLLRRILLKEIVEKEFTDKQKQIYKLFKDGYKATEIAKITGVSDAAINKARNRIADIIRAYKVYL